MVANHRYWIVVFVLVSLVALCNSQECKSACDAGLTVCSALDYQIYIPPGVNGSLMVLESEYAANELLEQISIYTALQGCVDFMQYFICNLYHPSCNGTEPTPILPCVQMCDDYIAACGAELVTYFPENLQYLAYCASPGYGNTSTCSYSTNPRNASLCPYYDNTTLEYTGTCQPYNPAVANLTTPLFCAPFVDGMVWVPVDWPRIQTPYDYLFIEAGYYTLLELAYPIFPQECYEYLTALLCASYFPTCGTAVNFIDFTTVPAPVYPCSSLCERTYEVCWDFFVLTNLTHTLSNCSVSYSETGYVQLGNTYGKGTCRDYVIPPNATAQFVPPNASLPCPQVAFGVKTKYSVNESRCGLACPDSSYTPEEWAHLVKVTTAGSSLSLIFMTFLVVSYLVQYEKRRFPSTIHFWEFVATVGFAISFLINGKNPQENVWCKDPGTSATQGNNSACAAQGFLFIFFGLALAAWCLVIAFVIFYGVVQNKKVGNLEKYTWLFHIFCWGGPLAFAVAAIASKSIGYGPPLAWCFVHFEGFGYGDGGVSNDYPLFYIPMLVMFVLILILFTITVVKIINVRSNVMNSKGLSSRTLQAQIRVLIFILVVFVICVSIFEWRFEIQAAKGRERVGLDWAYCKMQIALGAGTAESECPGTINPARIKYSRTVGECFVLSGIGILIFVAFGADLGIYKHWYKIFKLGAGPDGWNQVHDLVMLDKDPFASSSNRTKSTSSVSKYSKSGESKEEKGESDHKDSIDSTSFSNEFSNEASGTNEVPLSTIRLTEN